MAEATDRLGNAVTAEQIVRQLAVMLGWGNTPPWHVLERDLAAKLRRLRELESPGHTCGVLGPCDE